MRKHLRDIESEYIEERVALLNILKQINEKLEYHRQDDVDYETDYFHLKELIITWLTIRSHKNRR